MSASGRKNDILAKSIPREVSYAGRDPRRPPAHDKFHRELGELKDRLLELAQAAENAIGRSITALLHRMPTWPARS